MNLIISWVNFIIIVSTFQEFNELRYLILSNFMFCFIYWYNKLDSFKTTLLFLILPSMIFWYIFFIYNDFLALLPVKWEIFIGLLFIYSYITLYLYCNVKITLFGDFTTFKRDTSKALPTRFSHPTDVSRLN